MQTPIYNIQDSHLTQCANSMTLWNEKLQRQRQLSIWAPWACIYLLMQCLAFAGFELGTAPEGPPGQSLPPITGETENNRTPYRFIPWGSYLPYLLDSILFNTFPFFSVLFVHLFDPSLDLPRLLGKKGSSACSRFVATRRTVIWQCWQCWLLLDRFNEAERVEDSVEGRQSSA